MSRIYLKKRKKKCLNVTELMLNWFIIHETSSNKNNRIREQSID